MSDFPERFELPPIPGHLAVIINNLSNPHPNIPVSFSWPKPVHDLAHAQLQILAPMCVPIEPARLVQWLWPTLGAVRNPPTEDDFKRFVVALELVAVNIPHVAWTKAAQRELIELYAFRPAVADVVDVVRPPVMGLISRVRWLRHIVNSPQTWRTLTKDDATPRSLLASE